MKTPPCADVLISEPSSSDLLATALSQMAIFSSKLRRGPLPRCTESILAPLFLCGGFVGGVEARLSFRAPVLGAFNLDNSKRVQHTRGHFEGDLVLAPVVPPAQQNPGIQLRCPPTAR